MMPTTKGLILTSIWMLMIIGCWGWGQEITAVESALPFLNYNMSRCHGTWYEVEKYNGFPLNLHKCVAIECKAQNEAPDASFLQSACISVSQVFKPSRERQLFEGSTLSILPGVLVLSLDNSEFWNAHALMVLAIDYDNYAVLSVCGSKNKFFCDSAEVLILTRQRLPDESVLRNARQTIRDKGLPLNFKVKIDQTNCPEP